MTSYLISPLWILLIAFIFCIFFWQYIKVQAAIAVSGITLYLLSSIRLFWAVYQDGIQVVQIGNWPAPFGITLVADLLASGMVLVSAIIALAIILYSLQDISAQRKKNGFFPVLLVMLFGVCGSFLTGDIFNLYVWFEVMLVASFVLIVLGNRKGQLEGAVKYVTLSFISSGFLLTGAAILYKLTGTLNMADLSVAIAEHPNQKLITLSAVFFLVGFGIKAAIFPFFSWLPASYPTPPIAIVGLIAGLLTKVGVYALIRFFTLLFTYDVSVTHSLLLILAGLTMFFGVLGAIAQHNFKKILSFHIVSQIGYMIMGLALFTPLAIAGSIFYIVHHILVKTNLFLISGIVKVTHGHYLLKKLGGVYNRFPYVTILFAISAFSLAGIPPLSGFWGKFTLAKAGLAAESYTIVVVSLVVGLLTLFSMSKIWVSVFWSAEPEETKSRVTYNSRTLFRTHYMLIISSVFLTMCTLFLTFYPDALIAVSQRAAEQLLDSQIYIQAVMGENN
ncbi:MAG TPA: proton-conducting transporter membrane subunit [Saprospiraceae bacterium]|nr:proton-conducting transporter membrane subunit [Saprospiraceae bacterium]